MTRALELPCQILSGFGCSGGTVMSELFLRDRTVRRAALGGASNGQRMAALPCALVARALCDGVGHKPGTAAAYEFLGARALLQELVMAGFELKTGACYLGGTARSPGGNPNGGILPGCSTGFVPASLRRT